MAPGGHGAGNLPAELTSFVGRRDEVAEVRRLLAGSHLVTLTGVGGVGKTRLALRAAAGLARAFPDGVWLVRLDQLHDEALVAQAVAGTLGLQDRAGYSPAASLAEYLAHRRLLLVLDNCEHLIDAAAKLVDRLLSAAPDLRALATSRETLNIDAETVLPVAPLAAPEPGRRLTVAELGLFPAVQLFADRAGQVVAGFAVTGANQAAVAGICERLEGLPLAIELAAAQTRVLSPEQIEARLSDRLGLLTRGSRARPARQQTLRASIEWSHELCTGPERLLWPRLSVFAGGFELDAAEGICADHRLAAGQVLGLLAALADKSILITEHGQSGVVRYRLPETLREFGQERLYECGEHLSLHRRHRDWHEQLATRADTNWLSPQMTEWAARLLREYANMRAAQDFCQAEPGEAESGLRIATHVWLFYYWGAGYVNEGRYRLSQVLALAPESTMWRARGLLVAGFLAAISGDRGAAQALLEQGTSLARQVDDPVTHAFAAWVAGISCLFTGDLRQAIAHCEEGLAVLPPGAHTGQRVHLLIGMMGAVGLVGDEERAAACHQQLAALTEASGEFSRRWSSGYSMWGLGVAAWRRGDLDRAAGLVQQSLRLRTGLNDPMGSALSVEALAWIAGSGRRHERGAVLLGAAEGLRRPTGASLDGFEPVAACHRDCEHRARQALGESAFRAAYDRGLGLPAEDAVDYSLQQPSARSPMQPLARPPEQPRVLALPGGGLLTPRELEVARLVARGRSNKRIAAELVISQRTAEGHVEHILAKLGFTSRAQVAAWIAASQPDGEEIS
jgi:predicted ATPase/DNA-binding CsgD family transcriptional regulator